MDSPKHRGDVLYEHVKNNGVTEMRPESAELACACRILQDRT